MADFEKMYCTLFNSITDAVEALERETEKLKNIQRLAEEMYISSSENEKNRHDEESGV